MMGLFSFGEMTCIDQKMQADKDHDGRLTLGEMIENPYAFYGSVYLSDDEDYLHDEFRWGICRWSLEHFFCWPWILAWKLLSDRLLPDFAAQLWILMYTMTKVDHPEQTVGALTTQATRNRSAWKQISSWENGELRVTAIYSLTHLALVITWFFLSSCLS